MRRGFWIERLKYWDNWKDEYDNLSTEELEKLVKTFEQQRIEEGYIIGLAKYKLTHSPNTFISTMGDSNGLQISKNSK